MLRIRLCNLSVTLNVDSFSYILKTTRKKEADLGQSSLRLRDVPSEYDLLDGSHRRERLPGFRLHRHERILFARFLH